MKLGKAIKDLRRKTGLTQNDLADRVDITQSHLSQLENGKKEPSLSTLDRIAEEFGLSVPALFVLAVDEDDIRPDRKEVYEQIYPKLEALLKGEVKTSA